MRSLHFRKLNIAGKFAQLHTLILDSNRVTGFGESCFSAMPNLSFLSMCDTVVSDLWTASAALLKLPSLEVLRFQIWICCSESSTTPLKPQSSTDENMFDESNSRIEAHFSGVFEQMDPDLTVEETLSMDDLNAEVFMREKVKTHIDTFLFLIETMKMVKVSLYGSGYEREDARPNQRPWGCWVEVYIN